MWPLILIGLHVALCLFLWPILLLYTVVIPFVIYWCVSFPIMLYQRHWRQPPAATVPGYPESLPTGNEIDNRTS
ncbi:hypothetical protein BDV06DRAFT_116126 [Aspergillus oleicola]